jgi:hypothetical protein
MKILLLTLCFLEILAGHWPNNLLSIDLDITSQPFANVNGLPTVRISLLVQKTEAIRIDSSFSHFVGNLLHDLFPNIDEIIFDQPKSLLNNNEPRFHLGALINPSIILRTGDIVDNDNYSPVRKQELQWGHGFWETSTFDVYSWSLEKNITGKFLIDFLVTLNKLNVNFIQGSSSINLEKKTEMFNVFLSITKSQPITHQFTNTIIQTDNFYITAFIKSSSPYNILQKPLIQAQICRKVSKQGFKRSLQYVTKVRILMNQSYETKSESDKRLKHQIHCSIALLQRIPTEIFLDLDEMRRHGAHENCSSFFPSSSSSSISTTLLDPEQFYFCAFTNSIDVEKPVHSPFTTQHTIILSREFDTIQEDIEKDDKTLQLKDDKFIVLKATFGLNFQFRYQEPGCIDTTRIKQDSTFLFTTVEEETMSYSDGSYKLVNEKGIGSGGCYRQAVLPKPSIHLSCRKQQQDNINVESNHDIMRESTTQSSLALLYTALGGKDTNDWVSIPESLFFEETSSKEEICDLSSFISSVPVGSLDDSLLVSVVTTFVTIACAVLIIMSAAASGGTKLKFT